MMRIQSPEDLGFDPNQVTPGWIGFAATAVVGVVVILLLFDFYRRVSRIDHRAEARKRVEAEVAERDARVPREDDPDEGGATRGTASDAPSDRPR